MDGWRVACDVHSSVYVRACACRRMCTVGVARLVFCNRMDSAFFPPLFFFPFFLGVGVPVVVFLPLGSAPPTSRAPLNYGWLGYSRKKGKDRTYWSNFSLKISDVIGSPRV